jgi:glyoxylase-like metal-dependent hydrolase (beta-lactamase superfamily II)
MKRTRFRTVVALAAVAALGVLISAGTLRAADKVRDFGQGQPGQTPPPQTLPQGFESHRELAADATPSKHAAQYSAWIVESSRFMDVPHRAFEPDRGVPPTVNLPVNLGIIKAANGDLTLYDTGWKQRSYIYDWNSGCCDKPIRDQMVSIGLDPNRVKHIVIGHAHWDHAGQISEFPGATLYVQKEELRQIDFFLAYPLQFNDGHIHAVNTVERHSFRDRQDLLNGGGTQQPPPNQACSRTPVCGYPPQTLHEIFDKLLAGEAKIIDGRHEIEDGLIIHPAFRGHTYGSQLLQVNTSIGQLVFGSDTYSSWEGIRDWQVANIQQTDTIQQFLAYEKCYALTSATPLSADGRSGSYNNCISAHEPNSYSAAYPITSNWWMINGGNCSRAAELVLSNGEPTHKNGAPVYCETRLPPGTFGYQK